jgi:hypothetical protein
MAVKVGMYSAVRTLARPPMTMRRPRKQPLSQVIATPTRAAMLRRSRVPSSGSSAIKVRAEVLPMPGTETSKSSAARQAGVPRTASSRSVSRGGKLPLQPGQMGLEAALQTPVAELAPALALAGDHLD